MFVRRFRIGLRTFLACVAILAVGLSIVTREAKRRRGWITPGDVLIVEVLEGVPGHPITGKRLVCSDGTIDLSFYGKLKVQDLTTDGLKIALINHLRGFLTDELLGIDISHQYDYKEHCKVIANCNRVFVDIDDKNHDFCNNYYVGCFLDYVNYLAGHAPAEATAYHLRPCCPPFNDIHNYR
jgi:hypothetical protein